MRPTETRRGLAEPFTPSRVEGCSPRGTAGDVTIFTVLLLSLAIIVGALSLLSAAVGNLSRTKDLFDTSQALYAADTGIERALADYRWSDPLTSVCANVTETLPGTTAQYSLIVKAGGASGTIPPSCPDPADIKIGTWALCVEARGLARGGTIQRRVSSDTDLNYVEGVSNRCGS